MEFLSVGAPKYLSTEVAVSIPARFADWILRFNLSPSSKKANSGLLAFNQITSVTEAVGFD